MKLFIKTVASLLMMGASFTATLVILKLSLRVPFPDVPFHYAIGAGIIYSVLYMILYNVILGGTETN